MSKGRGIFKDLLIMLLIGVVLLGGGYFLARKLWFADLNITNKVSYEREEKLGDLFRSMVETENEPVEGNAADTALQIIASRLVKALDSTHYRYEFTILNSEQINAFTIPGGNIYVFSGLMKFCESPEEFAAVLSHEIGHAEERHVVTKMAKEFSMTIILAALSGGDPSLVAQILKQIVGSKFDREQETNADEFALKLLEKAKVSPKTLSKFFQRLHDKDKDYDESLELLMSHPTNDSRIDHAKLYKTKNGFIAEPFEIKWDKVKESLK